MLALGAPWKEWILMDFTTIRKIMTHLRSVNKKLFHELQLPLGYGGWLVGFRRARTLSKY